MEFTLVAAAALASGAVYGVLWWEGGRTNATECTRTAWDALLSAAIVGMIVGRLIAMVRAGTNPITHPADILIVRGGVDTLAAGAAALTTYMWMVRPDVRSMIDAAAPAAVAGLAGWHGACTVRDACLGSRSGLPWAVAQSPGGTPRHPVEIYAALLLLAGAALLLWWKRHPPRPGVIGVAAIGIAAGARAITEPMRLGIGSDLRWWYTAIAVAAVAVAAVVATSRDRRRRT